MSARKSLTSKADTSQNIRGNSAKSFKIVQCSVCSAEVLAKDVERHRDSSCKEIVDFFSQKNEQEKDWKENIPVEFKWDNEFGNVLLAERYLHTSLVCGLLEDDIPPSIEDVTKCLFLAGELFDHLKFTNGNNVTVYVRRGKTVDRQVFAIHRIESEKFKSGFTIGTKKLSDFFKIFHSTTDSGMRALIHFDDRAQTVDLASIHLDMGKRKSDVFKFLQKCCLIQRSIVGTVFTSKDTTLTVENSQVKIVSHRRTQAESQEKNLENALQELMLITRTTFYRITDKTRIIFNPFTESSPDDIEMVGYEEQYSTIEQLIFESSEYCERNSLEVPLPRSILLTGSTGTGKTIAMRRLFKRLAGQMNLIRIHASIFLSKQFEFERLESFFEMFIRLQPSVLFLDNLEDLSNEKSNLEKRVVSWLKVLLDNLPKSRPIFMVGACTQTDLLDSSLRRPGRFDLEIDFPIPSPVTRQHILEGEFRRTSVLLSAEQISQISESTHGFTGADLKHLCDMARLRSIDQNMSSITVNFDAILSTLKTMKPSVMREISLEKPNVFWTDIGGMQNIRHLLEETVVWPIKHPDAFLRMGIEPPRGILMYGPPGCCKTMIGKALATESGLNFFSIKGPELFSKWVGESERAIREMFRKARAASPSILFFDEIDALAAERGQKQSAVGDRVLAQLLTEIDGVEKLSQVVIVAATNRPDIVDKALLRPGRLDSMVYVPLPNTETRREIIRIRTSRMPLDSSISREKFIQDLAEMSEGYTGAEVTALCQTAGLAALSENIQSNCVTLEHFDAAFKRVRPRIDAKSIEFYEEFAARSQA